MQILIIKHKYLPSYFEATDQKQVTTEQITCYGSHSVTCNPAAVTFPPLLQPKLVLDLSTPEGYKAELTWVLVISQDSLPMKYGHLSQK